MLLLLLLLLLLLCCCCYCYCCVGGSTVAAAAAAAAACCCVFQCRSAAGGSKRLHVFAPTEERHRIQNFDSKVFSILPKAKLAFTMVQAKTLISITIESIIQRSPALLPTPSVHPSYASTSVQLLLLILEEYYHILTTSHMM